MPGWKWPWVKAQLTGVLFSTVVWIIVAGWSVPALAAITAVGALFVAGRNTRAGLWWRFGARPATVFERDKVLAAIVPIASLRGRNQPAVWIGRRLAGRHAVMATRRHLIVTPQLVGWIAARELSDRQVSAMVSHALGHHQVNSAALANAADAYCVPWGIVRIGTGIAGGVASTNPALGFSWKIRWVVFGVAAIDSYNNGRWAALIGVVMIAILSWSTGHFRSRWARTLQDLGDQRTIAGGFGPDLATLIRRNQRSIVDSERAERLEQGGSAGRVTRPGPRRRSVLRCPAGGDTADLRPERSQRSARGES